MDNTAVTHMTAANEHLDEQIEAPAMTAAAKRFMELDRLAFDFVRVDTDIKKLSSLNFEEHAYVMSMAYLYAMYRLGALSKESCIEVKRRRMRECRRIHNSLVFTRHLQSRWLLCTKVYYREKGELVSMLRRKDPEALNKALELIDILSGEYIYTKLYERADTPDKQIVLFDELINEAADEAEYDGDREELKQLVGKIIEEMESGALPECFECLTEDEEKRIAASLPPKEHLTEDVIKELMPRVGR